MQQKHQRQHGCRNMTELHLAIGGEEEMELFTNPEDDDFDEIVTLKSPKRRGKSKAKLNMSTITNITNITDDSDKTLDLTKSTRRKKRQSVADHLYSLPTPIKGSTTPP